MASDNIFCTSGLSGYNEGKRETEGRSASRYGEELDLIPFVGLVDDPNESKFSLAQCPPSKLAHPTRLPS